MSRDFVSCIVYFAQEEGEELVDIQKSGRRIRRKMLEKEVGRVG